MLTISEVLSKKNQKNAMKNLLEKKTGHGEDGITIEEFPKYWQINSEKVINGILDGSYIPGVINSYEIIGKSGKKRDISSLNVTDRFISRLIAQKLKRYIEPLFYVNSYAYQDGKGILDAVNQARKYIDEGCGFVVDIDIKSFFDNIDLHILLDKLIPYVDEDVINLIKKYLFCKVRTDTEITDKQKGVVQGNPISPILSNLYLHSLDEYLTDSEYNWIRFADDIKIYADSQDNASRIYNEVKNFLKNSLYLDVNEFKSGVYNAVNRRILGYEFYRYNKKLEIRKYKYKKEEVFTRWHQSGIQRVNQEYHIINDGVLNKQDYSLLFENENQKKQIPVEALEQICIYSNVTIAASVLKYFTEHNIRVIYVNKYGENIGYFTPVKSTKDAKVMLEQVKLYIDNFIRKEVAGKMELAAFHNMRANLRYYNKKSKINLSDEINEFGVMIKQVNEAKSVDEMMMIEARARQIYYRSFNKIIDNKDFAFEKRTKRPPEDEINAMISFGNTLLYNSVLKAIWKTSIDPKIGVVHATNRRAYSLNLDIADIYKPIIVDRVIFSLINKLQIKKQEHFVKEDKSVYLNDKGRRIMIEAFQEKLADRINNDGRMVSYSGLLSQEVYNFQNFLMKGEKYKPYKYY